MLLSTVAGSTLTSSRSGTSGAEGLAVERTRRASNSSGVVRLARGSCSNMIHVFLVARNVQQVHRLPAHRDRKVSEMVSALMPLSAAFSLSMMKRALVWSASIYQSVSTTPLVLWKMSITLLARARRLSSFGP